MSRAFVKEDQDDRPPEYGLPEPGSPGYRAACAWALITGANQGDSRSAELATGCKWGDVQLAPHVRRILKRAETHDEWRIAQLCKRFLKAAGADSSAQEAPAVQGDSSAQGAPSAEEGPAAAQEAP